MKKISIISGDSDGSMAIKNYFFEYIYTKTSKEWTKISDKKLLSVFKDSISKVKAYKEFILLNEVDGKAIKTIEEFKTVPAVTKKNYLRAYPWEDLCKNKSLNSQSIVLTSTSGSTGKPFYFPRTSTIDIQSSLCHEMFLRSSNISKNKSTLVVNCFGMGVWIGGLITYQAFRYIAKRGYAMSIITPGVSKCEIFQSLQHVAKKYDQIILCGYPPFIKDIIDEAPSHGIVWSDFDIKIIFAAEGFSESFRDYVIEKIGIKNLYRDTMNVYGSADLGTMAQETPLCILLRRLALENSVLYERLFGQGMRLPTLAQYVPEFINFETPNGSVLCTGDNVLPLVRYEIGDTGKVMTYDEMLAICNEVGVDIIQEMKNVGIEDTRTELPFIHVYERSDFSTSFYGVIIYPEYIKKGLAEKSLCEYVTGKFVMQTHNDKEENQHLEIHVELKQGKKATKKIQSEVVDAVYVTLLLQSTEFKRIADSLKERACPIITFWPHGHAVYFTSGAKQKWVKK